MTFGRGRGSLNYARGGGGEKGGEKDRLFRPFDSIQERKKGEGEGVARQFKRGREGFFAREGRRRGSSPGRGDGCLSLSLYS